MKKSILILSILLVVVIAATQIKSTRPIVTATKAMFIKPDLIHEKGDSVSARVKTPSGFDRVVYTKGTFQEFIQNYPLKPFGSKVINYDKTEYFYQSGHVGVLDLSVPKNGLQQCADALIRLRSEYLWKTNQQSKIGFEFTSGHYCSWKKYAEGYRPKVKGNKVTFHKTAAKDDSKKNFYKFLNLIYMYSGTLSLYNELPKIKKKEDLKVGDMLVYPGTPGHIIMIVDEVKNDSADKRFILAQGNTPAQSVHMLKNPNDAEFTPWYELEIGAYVEVPGYYFNKAKFIRFKD